MPLRGARSSKRSKRAEIDPDLSGKESDQVSLDRDSDPLDRITKKVQSPPVSPLTTNMQTPVDKDRKGRQNQVKGAKASLPGSPVSRTEDHDPRTQGVFGATVEDRAEPCMSQPLIELEANAESILTENLLQVAAKNTQIGKVSTETDEFYNREYRLGDRLLVREPRFGVSDSRLAKI